MTTPRERIAKALSGAVIELESLGLATTTVLESDNTGHLKWRLPRPKPARPTEDTSACFCPGCGKQVAVIVLEKGKTFGRQKWICCDEDGNRVHVWLVEHTAESFTLERGDPNE